MNQMFSFLFVPAISTKMVNKALTIKQSAIILDLEDSIAHSKKHVAREKVSGYMSELNEWDRQRVYIRINDSDSPYFYHDLQLVKGCRPRGIFIPKSEDKNMIKKVATYLADESIALIPLIETAKGIHYSFDIATATETVERLAFGAVDYCLDTNIEVGERREELLYARSQLVNASAAAKTLPPIDSVFLQLENSNDLIKETNHGRKLGFAGKLAIHPNQVVWINDVYHQESKNRIQEAKEVIRLFENAEKEGKASINVNGRLVDYPVYKQAKKILQINNE
ncbi:HpcH/HpaI aldolase/citrate lyase family protein [Cytobacillus sp. FSL K6-0265]|uniref:HpcH/HpaI aldolase/citrate lyase family protein n=1 Tax=Cytobacillus sp. FSL K6-0265 TaxID=2921448 RepID=UPI0030F5CCBC